MRPARILATLAMLAALSGSAHAQNGCARLSWGTCDPWVENQNFVAPQTYTLVESMFGVSAPNVGTDTRIILWTGSPVPDAWRFDDAGCQTSSRFMPDNTAWSSSCPVMKGTNPQTFTEYEVATDVFGFPVALMRLTITYDSFTPSPATRYTIWRIVFDHSRSSPGPTPPDHSTCGGAEICETFTLDFAQLITPSGLRLSLPGCDQGLDLNNPCAAALWDGNCQPVLPGLSDGRFQANGSCPTGPVATLPATWGRVKSLYR